LACRGAMDMTMDFPRRGVLQFIATASVLAAASKSTFALDYPTRPVKIVIGFAPGGPADILARVLSQYLSERLGQPFVIENRPGAGTTIAAETVVRSVPDGYTLLWTTSGDEINPSLYQKLNYNFIRDIAPVASIDLLPLIMEVAPTFPATSVAEFIAYAKANPGKINFASGGVGSSQHVAGELFDFMTGVKMVHVPYRGTSLALNDLLAGQVQVTFSPIPASVGHIRAGRLRALAVTSAKRSPALPDVPTVAETVPGYEAVAIDGLGAPAGTPKEIIATLNAAVNAALGDQQILARLQTLGSVPNPMSSAEFANFIATETAKWAKVVKFANITAE
jgi:tripartite-type tricarboxylate transporter receptor subunit TctC